MDHRSVPLDVLREFARDESERTSLRQVAAALGLGRTTLQKFINAETTPHPRVRRQIALWYLASQGEAADDEWEEYRSALRLLVDGFPEEQRNRAAGELLEGIEEIITRTGQPAPAWIAGLRERGLREG